jgi:uncharacterized protein YbjQ (UPF0145 family)
MYRLYSLLLSAIFLSTASIAGSTQHTDSPGKNAQQNNDPERILILYDNPMEEHTVIGMVEAHGYNIEDENDLAKAIKVLKVEAARVGAHAVILMPPQNSEDADTENKDTGKDNLISGKAIRYKHFYY